MPLLTVCIPAYKSERWIATGLTSLQRQSWSDLRVLVGIEPVEAEPTIRICRGFASDSRIRYEVNPQRLGWGGNIRALLQRVDTPYFLILFHDDWLHSRYIETLLPPLQERPELSVCYGDIRRFGASTGRKCLPLRDAGLPEQLLDFFLARGDAVPVRGVTRSTVLEGTEFPRNEFDDFLVESEWTLHLLLSGRALHVHRPLYLKRRVSLEDGSVSAGWRFEMPVDRLQAALGHYRRRVLAGIDRAGLSESERRPIVLVAEAALLHRYAQFAGARFRLDEEQRKRALRIRREAESALEPDAAARVLALIEQAEARDAGRPLKKKARPRHKRRIAVIGAGIQGVCAALELAERDYRVTLLEAGKGPMNAASRWNEGKLHLGYLYAGDRSLRTSRRLLAGTLQFSKAIARLTGSAIPREWLSDPFVYGVPVASLLGADELERHFEAVDRIVETALSRNGGDYFGRRELPPRRRVDVDEHFDPGRVSHAFLTPERSVNPHHLAKALSARMKAHSRIAFVKRQVVERVTRCDAGDFELWSDEGACLGRFDAVVNAAGGSRLALDRSIGIEPRRTWLNRYKLAVYVQAPGLGGPSVTLVHGPFGDVVRFDGDHLYLSWYPICRVATSHEVLPPDPEGAMTRGQRLEIARASWDELASFIPALRRGSPDWKHARVRGGHIVAWGATDIEDPASGLHERFDNGVFSTDGYHSVDPGKYGMAPLYAQVVAERIDAGCSGR